MAETIPDRINATIRYAQGRIERATFKTEHDEWRLVLRLLEDIRDHMNRPPVATPAAAPAPKRSAA
jgi:hypothetical protein